MVIFKVTDNSLIVNNFGWAFNQVFNPAAQPPSKQAIAQKVLATIGRSGVSGVEVGEEFSVNLHANGRLINTLKFKRIENPGNSETILVQSLDFPITWEFSKGQNISSVVKGTSEAVGGFMRSVGHAFNLDGIKAQFDRKKKGVGKYKRSLEEISKRPAQYRGTIQRLATT